MPLACEQLPCEGVAELNVTPAGSVSVSVMPVALDGPGVADADGVGELLCRPRPGRASRVFVTARSAAGLTVVEALAVLLLEVGSLTLDETVAVLVIVPVRLRPALDLDRRAGAVGRPCRAGT